MKTITHLVLFLLPLFGLSQTYEWAVSMGGVKADNGNAIAVDASGNVYSTGVFQETVDFDPGSGTMNLTDTGGGDIYIQKLDGMGNLVWAKQIVSSLGGHGESIYVDASGNVYVTGGFSGTADFDPGAGTLNFTTLGSVDNIFVLKLDIDGNLVWATHAESTEISVGRSIEVDGSGNVYSTGNFEGTTDFDPGSGTSIITSTGVRDTYIQKHDAMGNLLWVKRLENSVVNEGKALTVDASGAVYVTGKFWETTDFDPGTAVVNLTSAGKDDAFVLKLDAAGDFVWVKQIGGAEYEFGYSIKLDPAGNIYSTGTFQVTADFDPGVGTANLTAAGFDDIYLLKLTSSGDFVWVKQMGGTGSDLGFSLVLDGMGNIFSTGIFQNTVDFDPGIGIADLTSTGGNDMFIQKLDPMGDFVWVKQIGSADLDFSAAVAIDDVSGSLYTTGGFENTADFDPGTGTANLTSLGGIDIFVLKLDVAFATPIDPLISTSTFSIYPNPATQRLVIERKNASMDAIELYDLSGKNVSPNISIIEQSDTRKVIDVSALPSGMYFLKTSNLIYKIIKQ